MSAAAGDPERGVPRPAEGSGRVGGLRRAGDSGRAGGSGRVGGLRRAGGFGRAAVLSFGAGLMMGAVYWALDITSPAPPLLGLTGLAGIVVGERTAALARARWQARRRTRHATPADPASAFPTPSPTDKCPPLGGDRGDGRGQGTSP
ncbi:DUF1427 family protein [Streptomyces sp. NPDC059785]|uniref:DUF1427 family protein n=1 Tax=unclassified Streptomyces TaxID=2593676 RepID=UPI00364E46EC